MYLALLTSTTINKIYYLITYIKGWNEDEK